MIRGRLVSTRDDGLSVAGRVATLIAKQKQLPKLKTNSHSQLNTCEGQLELYLFGSKMPSYKRGGYLGLEAA